MSHISTKIQKKKEVQYDKEKKKEILTWEKKKLGEKRKVKGKILKNTSKRYKIEANMKSEIKVNVTENNGIQSKQSVAELDQAQCQLDWDLS